MEHGKLEWLGNFINYLIYIYIFIKSLQMGTLNLFDMSIALIGLIASILIMLNNYTYGE